MTCRPVTAGRVRSLALTAWLTGCVAANAFAQAQGPAPGTAAPAAPASPAAAVPPSAAVSPAAALPAATAPVAGAPAAGAPPLAASVPVQQAAAATRPRPAARTAARPARPAPASARTPAPAGTPERIAAPAAPLALPGLAEHERQLQAIRQALLEATVSAPVRVQSVAWIDADGRLHEDSQYTSDARVRGVRVLSYVEDPQAAQPVRVQVDTQVLPPGVRPGTGEDPQGCIARQGRWRQGLHVEVQAGPGLDANSGPAAQWLAQAREALLQAAGQSRRWASRERPYQPATAYERALLGREVDQSDWLARLALQRTPSGLEAVVELRSLHGVGTPRQWRVPVAGGAAALAPALAGWVAELDRQTACEPVWFALSGAGEAWRLREGEAHGLRAGDRLLVVDRQHLAGRSLEPRAAPSVALVQVASVTSGGSALRWLAGPRPLAAGDWVALPL